ncbi:MAG: tRNA (adenosine(37)-N6)-threonylcarbamoyltransferase complex dimerization subunit type 1 TsaB [Flavobacteriales bacterium]|nr:tRNA (adenosine(37)-N6)-threonylcarbamoyltransferase complex dimerization subunit type 1 TsaB [Flavobacteriales bacterium]
MVAPLLAIETATRRCSVALAEGGAVLAHREEESERLTHAERLNVFIDEVLREAGVDITALAGVAVGVGPGSYTGLRIGLSAAKGLCYALGIPLMGMGSLDVLVHELRAQGVVLPAGARLMPMIDARRMEVFTQVSAPGGDRETAPHPLVLDEAWAASLPKDRTTVVFGDGADKAAGLLAGIPGVLHVSGVRPAHRGMVSLSFELFARGAFSDLAYLVPDYGKPANVTQPKRAAS